MNYAVIDNKLFKCEPVNRKPEVYTCIQGKIYEGVLINETKCGYRVRGGIRVYEHVVFKNKIRTGWLLDEQKPFYTEASFINYFDAVNFARKQLISMEGYYKERMIEILNAKRLIGGK